MLGRCCVSEKATNMFTEGKGRMDVVEGVYKGAASGRMEFICEEGGVGIGVSKELNAICAVCGCYEVCMCEEGVGCGSCVDVSCIKVLVVLGATGR